MKNLGSDPNKINPLVSEFFFFSFGDCNMFNLAFSHNFPALI